jgi:hypothetical protein
VTVDAACAEASRTIMCSQGRTLYLTILGLHPHGSTSAEPGECSTSPNQDGLGSPHCIYRVRNKKCDLFIGTSVVLVAILFQFSGILGFEAIQMAATSHEASR